MFHSSFKVSSSNYQPLVRPVTHSSVLSTFFFQVFMHYLHSIHLTCQGAMNNTARGIVKILNVSLKVSLKATSLNPPIPTGLFNG